MLHKNGEVVWILFLVAWHFVLLPSKIHVRVDLIVSHPLAYWQQIVLELRPHFRQVVQDNKEPLVERSQLSQRFYALAIRVLGALVARHDVPLL